MSQRYLGGIITANPTAPTLTSASGVWTTEQQFQNIANWPKSTGLVSRSVRLRSSASAYFNRTPASAGNLKTWTVSLWVKRGLLSNAAYALFGTGANNTNDTICYFGPSGTGDQLDIIVRASSTIQGRLTTTQQFRDPSAWYHIVFAYNSPDATASERMKLYVNGVRVTAFSSETQPAQNTDSLWNTARALYFGRMRDDSPNYLDGYLTEINFIDGQALTPSYFGFTDGNGIWQPATYSGTYGTNGFYLNFSDNSGVTATTIGKDYSGNGNNWTPNNISVTAGVTYDSMIDVPTLYADGGNGRGNYCVLNPLNKQSNLTLSSANLDTSTPVVGTWRSVVGTVSITSGKWYWEATAGANGAGNHYFVGIAATSFNALTDNVFLGSTTDSWSYYGNNGTKYNNNSSTAYGASYTTNDVIGIAYDADAGTLTFYKNGASQGTAFTGLSGAMVAGTSGYNGSGMYHNFGQRPFTYTPPTGFVALNTQNLPAPTISNGATVMAATLYAANGSTQTISNAVNGVSMQPDFVWVKSRQYTTVGHSLFDALRPIGVNSSLPRLVSNSTDAETNNGGLTAFVSNGFSLNNDAYINSTSTGGNMVAWQWNAGGSTVTNTSGSISAQVRANATAGFSIVTYTGNGTSGATVGHGLGVAPAMMIIKLRNSTENWPVYHKNQNASPANGCTYLSLTNAYAAFTGIFNNTVPTSSVFTLGNHAQTNGNTNTYVAYCFAAVAGYSAFGSYTGNGSADGVFVYLGFRARFLMIKRTDSTGGWVMLDTARDTYNDVDNYLYANSSAADAGSSNVLDINSNGFKIRNSWTDINASGGTYVYAAFAENPFKLSRAR